ncbi:serine/threonine-protein phosphatase 7 long form homolog [Primulina huaijiensis]|uniref:serine/threonine-protein phosphatase 7 long form homolog n=1 Tax=Primulina huaijiensis TaxID=1492673 RepID=UPI003CC77996
MLVIGGCMLPDSEGCAVKLLYLHFLQDIHKVRSYSWASAVLAYLYHELCSASESGKQEIAGALYILQIWAWSRMIPLCPDRLGYNLIARPENENNGDNILPIPPYGARWKNVFTWTHTPTHSVRIIRDVLEKMGDCQFKWLVYDLEAVDVLSLPLECRHPTLLRSVCPLICFHIVEMHRPNRVLRQFGMSQNIPISALDGDHLHECSRRGRKNYDWVKHHRLMVDAWENRRNLIVESDLVENYSMKYDYETWYDSITRRFISSIEPQQIDYGYQPGDAYFKRIVRDETSNLKNLFGGLSVDDQPREALAEVVKKTIQTCDLLYEMSFRTSEQQHHHARTSNRRRRLRDDDVADEPSFSTPDWLQSMSTQSPTAHSWPHSSHGDDPSHGTTTQSPVTLGWASTSHDGIPTESGRCSSYIVLKN